MRQRGVPWLLALALAIPAALTSAQTSKPSAKTPPAPPQAKVGETVKLPSGVSYTELRLGKGVPAVKGARIRVLYVGRLADGREFDSRLDRTRPLAFQLGMGKMIKGFEEGVLGMRVGGKRRIVVPPKMGYGNKPQPRIPPNSELTFEVELIGVSRVPAAS